MIFPPSQLPRLLVPALLVVACSPDRSFTSAEGSGGIGGASDGEDAGEGGQHADPTDTTPPSIVAISPPDGAIGVAADKPFEIKFSEPMNKSTAQAAYQSADVPAGMVTFAWNSAGDVMTVKPNQHLALAEGETANIEAQQYTFRITNVALDLAGNALTQERSVQFSTLRHIKQQLTLNKDLSGAITMYGTGTSFWIGDIDGGSIRKHLLTFELGALPNISEFASATVSATQYEVVGDPYKDFGTLKVAHVSFESFGNSVLQTDPTSLPRIAFSTDGKLEPKSADILPYLMTDLQAERSVTQLRFEFQAANNDDGETDQARFTANSPQVVVEYFLP